MRLRAVENKRLGQWHLCHDQWCATGETSIVATIMSTLDDAADAALAERIAARWNAIQDAAEEEKP